MNTAFDKLNAEKGESEKLRRAVLDTVLDTKKVRTRWQAAAPFSNPETNFHPEEGQKYLDSRTFELRNLQAKERQAQDSLKEQREKTAEYKALLDEAQERL